jgi:hypothetical protein
MEKDKNTKNADFTAVPSIHAAKYISFDDVDFILS